jgi:hypothetical protein
MTPGSAFRGYQALGENVTRYDGGFTRDFHEGIDLYREAAGMVRGTDSSRQLPSQTKHWQHPA